jgi:outer membrane immunogenic protein
MFRKLLLTCSALAAATTFAHAADLPSRVSAPVPYVAPVFTWTGFYLGINGGYGWGTSDFTLVQCGCMAGMGMGGMTGQHIASTNPEGGFFGGQIGYNYQIGSFVVGLEGTLDWSGIKGTDSWTMNGDPLTMSTDLRWFATVGPRLGYAVDRALFYVTGGAAWGDFKYDHTHNMAGPPPMFMSMSGSSTRVGWMIGGGVEYAFTNNVTAKLEYNYIDFGSHNQTVTASGGQNFMIADVKDRVNLLKVGLNYKF